VTPLSSLREAAIADAIHLVYREAGVPDPGERGGAAITPLDTLLAAFPLCCAEVPGLSRISAVLHLQRLAPPFVAATPVPMDGDDGPLAGFLYAAPVEREPWGAILVERRDIVERRRFSVAHELGHYLLHFCPLVAHLDTDGHTSFVEGLGYPRHASRSSDEVSGSPLPEARLLLTEDQPPAEELRARLEQEANAFAAALLMPEPVCQRLVARFGGSLSSAKRLASELLVSPAAMRVRLLDLGLLTDHGPELLQ